MWELDSEEGWAPKNWCFWTVVLEKTLESPLDCKEIHPVHSEGDQPWIFIGRTDAEAPILWPHGLKNQLIWEVPDARKDWGQEKGMTENEMVGWYHWLNGHEFEQSLGERQGQGSLASAVHRVAKNQTQLSNWMTDQQQQQNKPKMAVSTSARPWASVDAHHNISAS